VSDFEAPSARERQLARELRLLRRTVGLNGKEVADRLGWSASKVSRIETSRIGISVPDLDRLLELYHVPGDHAAALRKLAHAARPKGWWDAYADTLSPGYGTLIKLESGSRALRCYSALVPHALLQTPDYMRNVIVTAGEKPARAEAERRVQVCRRRQDVLDKGERAQALQLWAILDEAALRREISSPAVQTGAGVMRGQLARLAELAQWPNVTIQVFPFSAGLPPVTAGSFSILVSDATGGPDVVYLENKTRTFFIESEAEVHQYELDFELLSELALPPDESLDFIEQLLG
jgi:transcriptional regulator with XRE-family HTH domain